MKVGVIGIGSISGVHISALLSQKQDIVALCDIAPKRCEEVNKKHGISAKIYTDYKQMLDENDLDVIHICTPHYLHAEMVCEGLKRNINVLCEKPLAISLEQLEQIKNAVNESSAQLGVCFQNRFNDTVVYVRDFLKDKKVLCASSTLVWKRDASYYNQEQGEWRGTWDKEGGGVMINQSIHGVDLMQLICGMPETVTANISNVSLRGVVEVEDTAFGVFKLANGSNFVINATNSAEYSFLPVYTIRADEYDIEITGNNLTINGKTVVMGEKPEVVGKMVWGTGHQRLISIFYSCLESGEKFPIGYDEGCKAVKLVLAMYRSKGEEITIEP